MGYLNTGNFKRLQDMYIEWTHYPKYAFRNFTFSSLYSANLPALFGVVWYKNDGSVTEGVESSASNSFISSGTTHGDVVNVNFYVWASRSPRYAHNTGFGLDPSVSSSTLPDYQYWKLIGKIKKSRDISNRHYQTGTAPQGHRFTIDYSELVQDQLSYCLCPINKGTWKSYKYGGMNGGLQVQDNVVAGNSGNPTAGGHPISEYNVTENGSYVMIRIGCTFDIIDANGFIHETTKWRIFSSLAHFINSTPTIGEDGWYYRGTSNNTWFAIGQHIVSSNNAIRFLTNCPNHSFSLTTIHQENHVFNKPVRTSEAAEFLQFHLAYAYRRENGINIGYKTLRMKIETFTAGNVSQNVVYVDDFTDTLTGIYSGGTHNYGGVYSTDSLYVNQIQNISPIYINANGKNDSGGALTNQITSTTVLYSCHLEGKRPDGTLDQLTDKYYYEMDREETNQAYYLSKPVANRGHLPVDYVRFHWLNRMGGIDSYTAKRDVVESLSVSKDTIDRKKPRMTMNQAGFFHTSGNSIPYDDFINNTMRGGDFYKGGREVMNVNAERAVSVYTDPLQKRVAKWLEEIITSPNVWVEKQTEAARINQQANPQQRNNSREYIPIIITNSDITTVDQSQGLVKFNIEFVYSFAQNTQRN
tara:strand:+ start:4737 stop:6659 length:1923 start_codon:yes stop_codon:yes gene_type:complete